MKFPNDRRAQPAIQREMPFFMARQPAKFVPAEIVNQFSTYREAVIWCWANRPQSGLVDPKDQSLFSFHSGMHPPHMSRCVNTLTKAPMDLPPDFINEFEAYTGWRGITQYIARQSRVTLMEEMIEQRRVA